MTETAPNTAPTQINGFTQDDVIALAAEIANDAVSRLTQALPGKPPLFVWSSLYETEQDVLKEVVKDIYGLPNNLTPEDVVEVGNIGMFVAVARTIPAALGMGVFAQIPAFTPAPVIEGTAPTEEPANDAGQPAGANVG